MATYWENSCSFGLRYVSWYKYLIVSLVFSHLGFWSGNLFLIAPFPDLCLLVPFDSISLPDICMESSECHTGFSNSCRDLIINVHCSGKSASQVGEFISNFQFFSIHSDGWFIVRFSRCWLVYNLCLFLC